MDSRDFSIKWAVVACVILSLWITVAKGGVGIVTAAIITVLLVFVGYFAKFE